MIPPEPETCGRCDALVAPYEVRERDRYGDVAMCAECEAMRQCECGALHAEAGDDCAACAEAEGQRHPTVAALLAVLGDLATDDDGAPLLYCYGIDLLESLDPDPLTERLRAWVAAGCPGRQP